MSTAVNDPRLIEGGAELLDRVEPLWTELRKHHADMSPMWRASLMAVSFDKRRAGLLEKSNGGMLVLLTSAINKDIGYCVSTVNNSVGEVDSIFVIPTLRGGGVGHLMMTRAMEWLAEKAVTSIVVDVLSGNEAAQAFYARYGFQPRTVRFLKNAPLAAGKE